MIINNILPDIERRIVVKQKFLLLNYKWSNSTSSRRQFTNVIATRIEPNYGLTTYGLIINMTKQITFTRGT